MSIADLIREKLQKLEPTRLELANVSARHKGHPGDNGTGESHFELLVVAPAFSGKSRLERHRLVNALLREELEGQVHALAIRALAPGEDAGA
jgi:BolA protein